MVIEKRSGQPQALAGEEIVLTPLEEKHLESTRAWMNDPQLMGFLGRTKQVAEWEHRQWFERVVASEDCVFFAIETCAGEHIGNIWLWNIEPQHRKAELRVVIGQLSSQNKGLGSKAIGLLCQYAAQSLGLHKVYAYVLGTNPRAKLSFEKAGFKEEGLLVRDRWNQGQYVDVHLMGLLLDS